MSLREKILDCLQEDARQSHKNIAVMLGETEDAVTKEVKAMEKEGVIVKYAAMIDASKLDKAVVEAYIELRVNPSHTHGFDGIAQEIARYSEVKNLNLMSGGYDFAVVVEGKNLREVAMFVSEKLSSLDNIVTTATHFILKRYKVGGVVVGGTDTEDRIKIHA